jgi:hypothetical protein
MTILKVGRKELVVILKRLGHAVALRRYTTSGKVESSNHNVIEFFFNLPNPSSPGVYSASNRNEYQKQKIMFLGSKVRWVGLTTLPPSVSRLSGQCWNFDISQIYRPSRPVTGIALLFTYFTGEIEASLSKGSAYSVLLPSAVYTDMRAYVVRRQALVARW